MDVADFVLPKTALSWIVKFLNNHMVEGAFNGKPDRYLQS